MANLGSIREQIDKDLERTYSDIAFFQNENTISALREILIVWSGKNLDIEYVQGMNEIAALTLYVVSENSLPSISIKNNPLSYCTLNNCYSDENLICFFNDEAYVTADAYALFSRLMKLGVKQLYYPSPYRDLKMKPCSSEVFFNGTFNVASYSLFYSRCYRIFSLILKVTSPELYDILLKQSIEPPIVLLYSLL